MDTKEQIQSYMTDLGKKARQASAVLAAVEAKVKNDALFAIADELIAQTDVLKQENAKDLVAGKEKGLDYTALIPRLKECTHHAIVFGEIADQLEAVFSQAVETSKVTTLEEAVALSARLAKHGDAVLLSPGTSSFDQFNGYEHRGDVFREVVLQLK